MPGTSPTRRRAVPLGLSVGGGAVVVAATFLAWFEATGPLPGPVTGNEMLVGKIALGLGLGVIACGALTAVLATGLGRTAVAVAGIVLAFAAALVYLYSAYAPLDAFAQFTAAEAGEGLGVAGEVKEALRDNGIVLSSEAGAWLGSIGSVAAVAGGVAGLLAGRGKGRPVRAGRGR